MRTKIFASVIVTFFSILVLGLFYTQILEYPSYKKLSENNRIRVMPLKAPRGKIYDRSGELLVSSRVAFDVEVIYQEVKDEKKVIRALHDISGIDKKTLTRKMKEAGTRPFIPVGIIEDIGKEMAIRVEEARLDLAGVIVSTKPLRNYIYKDKLSHVTGYTGEISRSELKKYKTYGYRIKDFVGKDGLERSYNDYLRGIDGGLQVEVDSRGRQRSLLAVKEPRAGKDLGLSIDIELQKFCDSLLLGKNGAILAMDPHTGAVLALVSHANFDPNIFIRPNNFKEIRKLLDNRKAYPMLNRAINGAYPPGSIFKLVVAPAALDSGLFDDKKTLFANGSLRIGNRTFRCWNEDGHGTQTISEAIKNSCNVFFYQLGLRVGPDEISKYAFRFGFGSPTGIDLPGEGGGFVPTTAWKRRRKREPWFKGETANYSIGQGYLLVTPLQILRLTSAIANDGRLVRPFLVERIGDITLRHTESQSIGLEGGVLAVIKKGMKDAVNAPHGTGGYARSQDIVIAGKTGTAQNPHGEPHAWFMGFAPFENPGLCVVVFIEHGGKGGLDPARFAREIIEEARKLELL